jgi:hypothetical protein
MKKLLIVIYIIFIAIASCEKSKDEKVPEGVYTGTFQRQLAFGGGDISNVTITFSSNTWTGSSDKVKYPALCHGTFSVSKQKITFTNDCAWTAEFDWSLILGGEYDFVSDGQQLKLMRDYSGPAIDAWTDIYILTKQNEK